MIRMDIIIIIIQSLAALLGFLTAALSILFFRQLHWPAPALWFLKIYASALSPLLLLIGVFSTIVGLATASVSISLIGVYNVIVFSIHIYKVSRPPASSTGFERAFGTLWEKGIRSDQRKYFVARRIQLKLPAVPEPQLKQNISFATIPDTGRQLLCDVWQPPSTIARSGLAFIYLHGSAFYFLDKDFNTRPFFRHLAAQGHVIMDVAYRLFPETDIMGMVNDVKRALVWMKENAGSYGVNPNRIVVGGGSAGGHLALLTAYTINNPQFTPKGLEGKDASVCAVISLYGSNDLGALYYHTNQHLTSRSIPGGPKKSVPTKMPGWIIKKMGEDYHRLGMDKDFENTGTLVPLLGGRPDECPERYAFFSPETHVHSECPPTLLIHDEHDIMAPVKTTRSLYTRLVEKKVLTVMHILPQTDHGFDLILPGISPSAHTAFYDVERFLALMMTKQKVEKKAMIGDMALQYNG